MAAKKYKLNLQYPVTLHISPGVQSVMLAVWGHRRAKKAGASSINSRLRVIMMEEQTLQLVQLIHSKLKKSKRTNSCRKSQSD